MSIDLSVNFVNKKLENPFILASAPPTRNYQSISAAFKSGWAGAITKSVVLEPLKDKSPRMKYYSFNEKKIALQNYEMGSELSVDNWVEITGRLSKKYPEKLLLVSLFASADLEEWKTLANAFYKSNIDGFELNFSCPHSDAHGRGYLIGQDSGLCGKITNIVAENSIPGKIIMPKLPYLSYPNERLIAEECRKNGANAISAINTIAGLTPINPDNLLPELNTHGYTTPGGFSYHQIKPFAYLLVRNLATTELPVSASGGVSSDTQTLVSFFAYGANHLQVCTEAMLNHCSSINVFKHNLSNYLFEKNLTLDELRGCAIDKVVSWDKL